MFNICYDFVRKFEGGHIFINEDSGGETIYGISRKNHPEWKGFKILDDYKKICEVGNGPTSRAQSSEITSFCGGNAELQELTKDFYKSKFYSPLNLDEFPKPLPLAVFDFAVHSGQNRAIKGLQTCLNNNFGAGLLEDGACGAKTLKALELSKNNISNFLESYLNYRLDFFQRLIIKSPQNKIFLEGWKNRVNALRGILLKEAKK